MQSATKHKAHAFFEDTYIYEMVNFLIGVILSAPGIQCDAK